MIRVNAALARHKSTEPSSFLKKHLQSDSKIERLWATALASEWGGVPGLGDTLVGLATDEDEKTETRREALRALEKGGDSTHISAIANLLSESDDVVRGAALRAWRTLADISPDEYVEALKKERSNTSFYGSLLRDPQLYAETLENQEIEKAFRCLRDHFACESKNVNTSNTPPNSSLGFNTLHEELLNGLLGRVDNAIAESSISFLVDLFASLRVRRSLRTKLESTLEENPSLWHRVLENALERADRLGGYATQLSNLLADTIPDGSEQVLPDATDLNEHQEVFLYPLQAEVKSTNTQDTETTVSDIIGTSSNETRSLPSSVTAEKTSERIKAVLENCSSDATCAKALIKKIWEIRNQSEYMSSEPTPYQISTINQADVSQILDLLDDNVKEQVTSVFKNAFKSLTQCSVARPILRYLVDNNIELSTDAIADFLESTTFWNDDKNAELEISALSYLREQNREVWKKVITQLASSSGLKTLRSLQHLLDCEDSFFLRQAEIKFRGADFRDRREWNRLLRYVLQCAPDAVNEILVSAFQTAEVRQSIEKVLTSWDLTQVLFELTERDDERGWMLLDDRVDAETVPLSVHIPRGEVSIPEPETLYHLNILSRWYKQIRQVADETSSDSDYRRLAKKIMGRIVSHASSESTQIVWGLQKSNAFKGSEWLSGWCLSAEDAYLATERSLYSPQRLLEFVLTDHFHLVQSERDLFEVLLQSFDDLQDDFYEGRGVAGFWKPVNNKDAGYSPESSTGRTFTSQPKEEEACQNVLWALIRPRLRAYGLTDVEENVIGPDYSDLRVEYARPQQPPHRVFIEVKVARRKYGPARIERPLVDQLWGKYLQRTGTNHGIYLVIWAKDPKRHEWPAGYGSHQELKSKLQERADRLKREHGVVIAPVVLDISTPYRSS